MTKSAAPTGSPLIPNSPVKPIRFWFETGDQDLFYPVTPMPDGMHDWTLADERMAKVLADKGYHYQFLFAHHAGHVNGPTVAQTLPEALEWLWGGLIRPPDSRDRSGRPGHSVPAQGPSRRDAQAETASPLPMSSWTSPSIMKVGETWDAVLPGHTGSAA